jgi:hypothetical protein
MYGWNNLFGQVTLLPGAPLEIPFLQKSIIYIFIVNHAHIILFFSFLFAFYKILLSHWISTVFISLGLMYMKWSQVFGKKDFNPMSVHVLLLVMTRSRATNMALLTDIINRRN